MLHKASVTTSPFIAHVLLNKSKSLDLVRYNAATTLISNGIPRPVASAILGHVDPSSLDYYTFANLTHLRECALSIENFPVREEVFDV